MSQSIREGVRGGAFLLQEGETDRLFTPEDFSEEHKMIARTAEEFVTQEVWPVLPAIEEHQFDHSVRLMKQAGELGLLGADVPEEYGGIGLDKISSSLITEKFALSRSFALTQGAHVGIGSLPIVYFGTEEQKAKYLPKLATGEYIAAYALTEPGSGSDALGAKTTARLSEDGKYYILNGEKQWITNAGFADLFVVYAKVDGEQFSAFIVERAYEGVSTGPEEKKMGIKGSSTRTLLLDEVKVPVENLLGEVGRGHVIAFNILNIGRFKLGVGCVGSSKRALEVAVQYAKERKQFQTPIIQFPLIQEKIGKMAANTYALESAIYRTAGLMEDALSDVEANDGQGVAAAIAEYAMECSITKVLGSEIFDGIADEAVQIHGGYGFMAEYEVENMYRDSRINRIFEGTNEINRLLIPNTLVKKTLKGELPFLQAATRIQEELLTYIPSLPGDEPLAQERNMIENGKKLFIMLAGTALQKYEKRLAQEQEILARAADVVIEIYAMESAYLRTMKAIHQHGEEREALKINLTRIYIHEAFQRIEQTLREGLVYMEDGDMLRTMLSMVKKLTRTEPVNLIALRRQVAQAMADQEKYLV